MEHAPQGQYTTQERIQERLNQIDLAIAALTSGLDKTPAVFEESPQMDDNATESELVNQALGSTGQKIENLRHEREELRMRLAAMEQKS